MIVSWPGHVPTNTVNDTHLVSGVDILPTICDYAGVQVKRTHGISLRPLLEGKKTESRPFVAIECRKTGRAIVGLRYKYIEYHGHKQVQFYNLKTDPWEMNNLAEKAEFADQVKHHAQLLREWERGVNPTPECKLDWT